MKHKLGHYDLVAELGRGGMGVVYKAYETSLNRFVAIKVLAEALSHDESLVERFMREARSMAALNDPHIIQVYFIGTDEGQPFFVMEFVEGESLSGKLHREGQLAPGEAAQVLLQTARGLSTAHDRGVIHRDIKPGNLMISDRGTVKIADFGIALATQDFSKKLTSTGEFVGTPGYLSPEVCLGKPVDQRSDIFSLGIVLFEMLTGKTPFTDESPLGLMLEVVKSEVPDVRELNEAVDEQLAKILEKMIAKETDERYQSCHELVDDLESHPLLAQGGPRSRITPAPKVRSDATVVTPSPSPRASASGRAAPAAVVSTAANVAATAARAAPPLAGPSAQVRAEKRSGFGLGMGLAIAAVVLLMLGVASAATLYMLRDQLPPVQALVDRFSADEQASSGLPAGTAQPGGSSVDTPARVVGTSSQQEPSSAGNTPGSGWQRDGSDSLASTQVTADSNTDSDSFATDRSASEPEEVRASVVRSSADTTASSEDFQPGSPGNIHSSSMVADSSQAQTADEARATTEGIEQPQGAADLGEHDSRRERPLVQLAQARREARQSAAPRSVTPQRPRELAVPSIPQVAVIALGDPALTGPVELMIEERLLNDGYRVVEKTLIPNLSRLLADENADVSEILESLSSAARVDALVLVRTRFIGQQELTYYGQSSTLFSVNLQVRAFSVSERRPLGGSFQEQVDFTSLNANEMAREAVEPNLSGLLQHLTAYRASGRG